MPTALQFTYDEWPSMKTYDEPPNVKTTTGGGGGGGWGGEKGEHGQPSVKFSKTNPEREKKHNFLFFGGEQTVRPTLSDTTVS